MEKLTNDEEFKWVRMTCRCSDPACSVEFTRDKSYPLVTLDFWYNHLSFWRRITYLWHYLWTGMIRGHEFIIREEDFPEVAQFFIDSENEYRIWSIENAKWREENALKKDKQR